MSIVNRSFDTVSGTSVLVTPYIYAVRLLGVDRSGIGQYPIPASAPSDIPAAGSRQFFHYGSELYFDPTNPFVDGEKVNVLYEI